MSKTIEEFTDKFVAKSLQEEASGYLKDLLSERMEQATDSEVFSPKSGEVIDIGEDGDIGFYVVTGDEKKARKLAKAHMLGDCGMDVEYALETLDNGEKMRLHLYTKPWETGIYSDWQWFAENSHHSKAKWVFKYKY